MPKALCRCRICREARKKEVLYARSGPSAFQHDINLLIDTPDEHISRKTLYTFEQALKLVTRLHAKKVVFVHLEEYWNQSYDDYSLLEASDPRIRFAYDGMQLSV